MIITNTTGTFFLVNIAILLVSLSGCLIPMSTFPEKSLEISDDVVMVMVIMIHIHRLWFSTNKV